MSPSMRRNVHVDRLGAAVLIAAVLAGCSTSSTASVSPVPSPTTVPAASATPAPTPSATLAPPESPSPPPSATPAPTDEPTGELYALDCGGDTCVAEYLPDGLPASPDPPGWPVIVSGPCSGLAKVDGISYAACDSASGVLVHAFDADASLLAGWPVHLPVRVASVYENLVTIACGDERSSLAVADDGTIFVATAESAEARLYALTPDGQRVAGWPRPFPGDPPGNDGIGGNGCRGFAFALTGDVVAWGYEGVQDAIQLVADRTEFTVYAPDGSTRPGWPRGSTGAASRPVVAPDGSIAYVSASGKVWRHDPDGEISEGWPYQLERLVPSFLSPDDRVVVLVSGDDDAEAISLDPDGDVTDGWPVDLGDTIESRCLFGDTPCTGDIEPAFGPDGTVYVSLAGGAITAIDVAGDVVSGWPVDLGARTHATDLQVDGDGRLIATGIVCGSGGCGESSRPTTLVFAPDGELLDQATGS